MLLSNFIVVTDYTHGRILQVNLLTGTVVKLPITTKKSPGLAFDKSTKTLFYCELLTNSIKYTTLQGENTTYFYTTGIQFKPFTLRKCYLREWIRMTTGFYVFCLFIQISWYIIVNVSCVAVSVTPKVVFYGWGKFSLVTLKA